MSDEARRLADYECTVAAIHQLTDVRFKLAAYVPTLTGAAVALLATSELGPLVKASLAIGGLIVSIGIVLYDLRNSQHYNSAVGRAEHLEAVLGLDRFGLDKHSGLFGSRKDTTRNKETQGLDHFLGLPVRHGQALALVYTSVISAWVWAALQQAADGLEREATSNWLVTPPHAEWIAFALAVGLGSVVLRLYLRHDRRSRYDVNPTTDA